MARRFETVVWTIPATFVLMVLSLLAVNAPAMAQTESLARFRSAQTGVIMDLQYYMEPASQTSGRPIRHPTLATGKVENEGPDHTALSYGAACPGLDPDPRLAHGGQKFDRKMGNLSLDLYFRNDPRMPRQASSVLRQLSSAAFVAMKQRCPEALATLMNKPGYSFSVTIRAYHDHLALRESDFKSASSQGTRFSPTGYVAVPFATSSLQFRRRGQDAASGDLTVYVNSFRHYGFDLGGMVGYWIDEPPPELREFPEASFADALSEYRMHAEWSKQRWTTYQAEQRQLA